MDAVQIIPYSPEHAETDIQVTVEAWEPVFSKTQAEVPEFVFDAFYPEGFAARQTVEVRNLLETEPGNMWLAMLGEAVTGFLGIRLHPEDQMGEIYIIAVAPEFQKRGVARQLMEFAQARIKAAGMKMIMVETIGDEGHAAARRAYESFGFQPWPVARYFKPI